MKRRNADCAKLRRPLKRNKITEGIYGSTFLYLKFLVVWVLVLMADFILEFRFEYLWPFWLLIRSVYDSFKYQGLAFSMFFVCIAITSDVICYLFIPVQWLFFAASTYVWVQYVWHTERGICLPTVSLWLLFVYIEASVRFRELKSLPFHLDLCRPFASHCIGYPVVTLGFGFKSYISYKMRVRKQKDVQKENDFFTHLLQQALPVENQQNSNVNSEKSKALPSKTQQEEVISNGVAGKRSTYNSTKLQDDKDWKKHNNNTTVEDLEYIEQNLPKQHNLNDYNIDTDDTNSEQGSTKVSNKSLSGKSSKIYSQKDNTSKKGKANNIKDNTANNISPSQTSSSSSSNIAQSKTTLSKDEYIERLELDVKKLKNEIQSCRNSEQELRSQVGNLLLEDKDLRRELNQLRVDNETLQTKLHNLVTCRQQDKQNIAVTEKKLGDERRTKAILEQQLITERKAKRAEEAAAARAVAMAAAARVECTESCKARRRDLDIELKQLRRDVKVREDSFRQLEREAQSLLAFKDQQNETEVLMSALAAMQDKNSHLENNLSAETRLKLDLFSALGEAKRQIEISQGIIAQKDQEVAELKTKIAEVLAVMPVSATYCTPGLIDPSQQQYTSKFMVQTNSVVANSNLNPNAVDYTPKSQ